MTWLLILLAGLSMDLFSVLCFYYTQNSRPWPAACFSVLMNASILFVVVDAVAHPIVAVPWLVGVFLGGFVGVKLKHFLEEATKSGL